MNTAPAFECSSEDELAERLTAHLRLLEAPTEEIMVISMKRGNVYSATVGSRDMLVRQVGAMDKRVAKNIRKEISNPKYVGMIPMYGMDLDTSECGLVWLPPFINAFGGDA